MLKLLFAIVVSFFKNQSVPAMENLALCQQLSIYHHSKKRPKIHLRDRLFWILASRHWEKWKNSLIIVKQDTVIGWHRKGFKLYWTCKSRKRGPGRPVQKKTESGKVIALSLVGGFHHRYEWRKAA